MKYKAKPNVVDAIQYNGTNQRDIVKFLYPEMTDVQIGHISVRENMPMTLKGREGNVTANTTNWIVRGADGGVSVLTDAQFQAEYEPAKAPKKKGK